MQKSNQLPLYELTRGEIVESIHFGSIAVSDSQGRLVAWYGDPNTETFLRSSAKPFQAIPLIEVLAAEKINLSGEQIALICASHSGTDQHVKELQGLQSKTGVQESQLQCGVHPPLDEKTAFNLRKLDKPLTPNRHNCSGKHTGMLILAQSRNWSTEDYIDPGHPLQQEIIQCFSEMSAVASDAVRRGTDGCSAPNFAVPLMNTAVAYARLCDPENFSETRAMACRTISNAMTSYPFMVGGPGRFDTKLMEFTSGRIVSKEGAEGYQAMGIMPGAFGKGSPALGIAIKLADGDLRNRARPAVALEVLSQLNILTDQEKEELSNFGPAFSLKNFRDIAVGIARPAFQLNRINSLQ
jgi:L-asparaginase II